MFKMLGSLWAMLDAIINNGGSAVIRVCNSADQLAAAGEHHAININLTAELNTKADRAQLRSDLGLDPEG